MTARDRMENKSNPGPRMGKKGGIWLGRCSRNEDCLHSPPTGRNESCLHSPATSSSVAICWQVLKTSNPQCLSFQQPYPYTEISVPREMLHCCLTAWRSDRIRLGLLPSTNEYIHREWEAANKWEGSTSSAKSLVIFLSRSLGGWIC